MSYVVTYRRAEFLRLWAAHDFPGPWDERVWVLTTDGKAAAGAEVAA